MTEMEDRTIDNDNQSINQTDQIDPLMCFECAEVFDNTDELKKHVQTHLISMFGKDNLDSGGREKMNSSFNISSYNKSLNDSTLKSSSSVLDDSNSESSYFDTYMKARGLDTPSFGGLKRERDVSKSPATMQQKQVTITVTSTAGDGKELKFICPICGMDSPSTEELGKHMEMHSGYKCNICGKSYSTKGNLQTHMRKHNGDKSAVCPFCNKTFTGTAVLKIHIRSHTGEKPFECETCGVAFAKNIHLKRHLSIHTGIKPHQCEICQKRFSRSDHLKRHIQSIHTQDRPHICSLCGKDFVRKYELNKHMKQMHWGFTVGANGNTSKDTTDSSFTQDQNGMENIIESELNKNMQKLQGAFTMGDNNNTDLDVKGQGEKEFEVKGQGAFTVGDNNTSYLNGNHGFVDLNQGTSDVKGRAAIKIEPESEVQGHTLIKMEQDTE